MGHIVFAAPGIDRFHLHDRLHRELQRRGHRTDTLLLDPIAHTFFRHQALSCTWLAPGAADAMRAPLDELAATECARLGLSPHHPKYRAACRRIRTRLARWLPAVLRWFEHTRPHLILLHERRSADQALLHFVARECGVRVLWTGDGLLPHTMQIDERGLDGDASASRRSAFDYRQVQSEPSLLQACLTNLLGRTTPSALARTEVHVPPLGQRLRDAANALVAGRWNEVRAAFCAWSAAQRPPRELSPPPEDLPRDPFVAVLLQEGDDVRVRLDAQAAPSPHELVQAAHTAAARLDPMAHTVVVLPHTGMHQRLISELAQLPRLRFAAANAAPEAAAAALATITINHPLAIAGLLAGSPVLHTGRALYALPGVTHQVPLVAFGDALQEAATSDQATLRERFLSRVLGQSHLWCSTVRPDHNGLLGLVQEIESRLGQRAPEGMRPRYRRGPAWPLAAEGRGN
jgi:hypothetical protein